MSKMNYVKARIKSLRTSPRKANIVLGLIRGRDVWSASQALRGCQRRISNEISKLLDSAIANAENNNGMDIDTLFVKEAYVGKAMVMKRWRPRAFGRAARIEKPFSNVEIILAERGAV